MAHTHTHKHTHTTPQPSSALIFMSFRCSDTDQGSMQYCRLTSSCNQSAAYGIRLRHLHSKRLNNYPGAIAGQRERERALRGVYNIATNPTATCRLQFIGFQMEPKSYRWSTDSQDAAAWIQMQNKRWALFAIEAACRIDMTGHASCYKLLFPNRFNIN